MQKWSVACWWLLWNALISNSECYENTRSASFSTFLSQESPALYLTCAVELTCHSREEKGRAKIKQQSMWNKKRDPYLLQKCKKKKRLFVQQLEEEAVLVSGYCVSVFWKDRIFAGCNRSAFYVTISHRIKKYKQKTPEKADLSWREKKTSSSSSAPEKCQNYHIVCGLATERSC